MKNLHDDEVRVTSGTGGQKGKKLCQIGALDPVALIETGRVAGMGANKYAAFNYLKGYDWSLSFNALMRHAMLFWAGETYDQESGLNHMAHVAWQALALVSFAERGIGTDDRPPSAFIDPDKVVCDWVPADLRKMLNEIIDEEHQELFDQIVEKGENTHGIDALANHIQGRISAMLDKANNPVA